MLDGTVAGGWVDPEQCDSGAKIFSTERDSHKTGDISTVSSSIYNNNTSKWLSFLTTISVRMFESHNMNRRIRV